MGSPPFATNVRSGSEVGIKPIEAERFAPYPESPSKNQSNSDLVVGALSRQRNGGVNL
jgi:hypothetical protein